MIVKFIKQTLKLPNKHKWDLDTVKRQNMIRELIPAMEGKIISFMLID